MSRKAILLGNLAVVAVAFIGWHALPLQSRAMFVFAVIMSSMLAQALVFEYRSVIVHLPRISRRLFLVWSALSLAAPFIAKLLPPGNVGIEIAFICFLSNVWILFLIGIFNLLSFLPVRKLGKQSESLVIVLLVLLFIGAASYEARLEYEINQIDISLGLSKQLNITLISDTHLGPVLGLDFCQRLEKSVNFLQSDIVVLVGGQRIHFKL